MNIIIAPHADDEIIGCYEIIMSNDSVIIYSQDIESNRKLECMKLKNYFPIYDQIFTDIVPPFFLEKFNTFYFPDPYFEFHPDHRFWGSYGERLLRDSYDIIFYSVNMQTPYIHKLKDWEKKEKMLNAVYPSQSKLWKCDKKYVLFEGRTKWLV